MSLLKIEPVSSPKELQEIETLAYLIWHEHYTPIIGKDQVAYMLPKFQSVPAMQQQIEDGYEYYSLKLEAELIGYFSIQPQDHHIFLSKIYLTATSRGKGYAKKALQYIEEKGKQHHATHIRLTVNKYNSDSIKAYLKMGFTRNRELVIDIGNGFVMDDYEMVKRILFEDSKI